MNDFTDIELARIFMNLGATARDELDEQLYKKIEAERDRREELSDLAFDDDCLSCKL